MKTYFKIIYILSTLIINYQYAFASGTDSIKYESITPFSGWSKNIADSYSGWNSLYHLGGIGLTYLLVENNYDAKLLRATSKIDHDLSVQLGFPGVMLGYLTPMTLPVGMYLFSDKNDN